MSLRTPNLADCPQPDNWRDPPYLGIAEYDTLPLADLGWTGVDPLQLDLESAVVVQAFGRSGRDAVIQLELQLEHERVGMLELNGMRWFDVYPWICDGAFDNRTVRVDGIWREKQSTTLRLNVESNQLSDTQTGAFFLRGCKLHAWSPERLPPRSRH